MWYGTSEEKGIGMKSNPFSRIQVNYTISTQNQLYRMSRIIKYISRIYVKSSNKRGNQIVGGWYDIYGNNKQRPG